MWKWLSAATAAVEPDNGNAAAVTARKQGNATESPRFGRTAATASLKRLDEGNSPVVRVTDRICAFVFGTTLTICKSLCRRELSPGWLGLPGTPANC